MTRAKKPAGTRVRVQVEFPAEVRGKVLRNLEIVRERLLPTFRDDELWNALDAIEEAVTGQRRD